MVISTKEEMTKSEIMIKFFSRIRKNLLMQNKIGTYTKYAIGEIFLVVVGILIALQINNWNEYRKDRTKEKALLDELNKDFKANLNQFNSIKIRHITAFEGAVKFKQYINAPDPLLVRDSIAKYYFQAFNGATFNPSNSVIESMISSGEYQLIQNDSLRNYIISWKDALEDYLEDEKLSDDLWKDHIEPFLLENGDLANLGNLKNFEMITTQKFKNLLERHIFYMNNLMNTINQGILESNLEGIIRLSKTSSDS